jgi:hypothetical protein
MNEPKYIPRRNRPFVFNIRAIAKKLYRLAIRKRLRRHSRRRAYPAAEAWIAVLSPVARPRNWFLR